MSSSDAYQRRGKNNQKWGHGAEQIATDWLRAKGYVIRAQNWSSRKGHEIDIIAEIPGTIVFIEVKARRGNVQHPLDAVDDKKIRNIVRGANVYLSTVRFPYIMAYRFDIITIIGNAQNYTIEHYEDAFLPLITK